MGKKLSAERAQIEVDKLVAHLGLPSQLPIADRSEEIVEAIKNHQVVVVAGETGSGKSTQLPKLCLLAGRGITGRIGHTQPRRLAAQSIAERIAAETQTTIGDGVGFAFRFNDRVKPATRIKLMTDGILLAEIQRDRQLRQYDTLIIDEAHERSLNIDFILGYLCQLLPRRPELKIIITSATIDTERFSVHFGDAPIIEVSGRTYPVEVRYQPPEENQSLAEQISAAVTGLLAEGDGDILVFLPGERDIRENTEALQAMKLANVEVFPLYARLTSAEQHRVFAKHSQRRIVLATNVAETSVTVPGIRYVVDPGTARVSRYSNRTKVQRLPIEAVSQASANQRAGRCGRVGPGICIRLYSAADFDSRAEFTEPEIKRSNLASVILQMASLGLGDISDFPFVERPDDRNSKDGIQLLMELDALDPDHHGTNRWLTPTGRELAKLPVDPRFGRMIVEAADTGALTEVLIITAGLSVQDPREYPQDNRQSASEAHARYAHDSSDFLTLVNLWRYVAEQRAGKSNSAFRRQCKREYLNYNRIREWQDIYKQLVRTTKELGYKTSGNEPNEDTIHQALLSGLLSQIGTKDQKSTRSTKAATRQRGRRYRRPLVEFLGARTTRFAIARGSVLVKNPPSWVMAAELVETDRMWARMVAPIRPDWVERLSGHIDKRSYAQPEWDSARGHATTVERVTLYGLPITANRRVTVGTVDPRMARELFIHHGLVLCQWDDGHRFTTHRFYQANDSLIRDVEELENRARRSDLLVAQKARHDFFDRRLPEHIVSENHFDQWWKKAKSDQPDLFNLTVSDLVADSDIGDLYDESQFPTTAKYNGIELELAYEFDTGSHLDGLSVHIPIEVLNQLEPEPFEWLVPGLRTELFNALARTIPKAKRRTLQPMNETVAAATAHLSPGDGNLRDALASALGRRAATKILYEDFDPARLPTHLRPTFRVINNQRELLAEGTDLGALQTQMVEEVKRRLSALGQGADGLPIERTGIKSWDFDCLPRELTTEVAIDGVVQTIQAFPALVDDQDSVAIRLFATLDEQQDAMWVGIRRLLRLSMRSPVRTLDGLLNNTTKLQLMAAPIQPRVDWYHDAIDCALDEVIAVCGGPAWTETGFERLAHAAQDPDRLKKVAESVAVIVDNYVAAQKGLDWLRGRGNRSSTFQSSVLDATAHLERLAYPGFLAGVGYRRLDDVARYLEGISVRLDRLTEKPRRDLVVAAECINVETQHQKLLAQYGLTRELEDLTWALEELRVAHFAQHLRPKGPDGKSVKISATRIQRELNRIAH